MGAICCVFSTLIANIQKWKLCCSIDPSYEELWNHRRLQKGSGPTLQMQPSVEHLLNLWGTCAGLFGTWVSDLEHPLWPTVHLQLLPCNVKCCFFCTPPSFLILNPWLSPVLLLLLCWDSAFSQAMGQLAHTDQAGTKITLESLVLGVCVCKTWLSKTSIWVGLFPA